MDRIRILVVDDHPVIRQGLAALLVPRNGMEVVGEGVNGRDAVELAQALTPDVIIMDMVLPVLDGAEAVAQIRAQNPAARVLMLTSFGDEQNLARALAAGAMGFLLKEADPDDLLHAIRSVRRGQLVIPQHLGLELVGHPAQAHTTEPPLTEREAEIADLIAEGLSNGEIAAELQLSSNTVRNHCSNILRKLDLSNRTQIAVFWAS